MPKKVFNLKKLATELPEALPGLLGFLKQVERNFADKTMRVRSETFDDDVWYEFQPHGGERQLLVGTYSSQGDDVSLILFDYDQDNKIISAEINYILLHYASKDIGNFQSLLRELKVLLYNNSTPTYLDTVSKKVFFVISDEDDESIEEDEDEYDEDEVE